MIQSLNNQPNAQPRLRIVVLGYIIRGPLGGLAWHHLQYVVGLTRLGHDVLFIEDSDDYPSCVHVDREVDMDPREGLAFADDAFSRLEIAGRFAYFQSSAKRWLGPAAHYAAEFCRNAHVVLNVSALNPVRPWWSDVPVRILIDTDPAFLQIRHLQSAEARSLAAAHNAFFTFGEKIGDNDCTIPDDGFPWRPTRQPVVLNVWRTTEPSLADPFSTVMQWDSYDVLEHEGQEYGMKSSSFAPFVDLPQLCPVTLLLGIGGRSPQLQTDLERHGWKVRDSIEFTRDPWQYQDFIQHSAGEFSVAKHGYVVCRTGWFSERSANYLASGRPVILQDTGFSDILPTGEGLLAFETLHQAREALDCVACDLSRHALAARRIAIEYFDAENVLSSLLSKAGALKETSVMSSRLQDFQEI